MIAKLRIWLSGVVMLVPRAPPEHKDAGPPDQREGAATKEIAGAISSRAKSDVRR
jgi:hypothetical protein